MRLQVSLQQPPAETNGKKDEASLRWQITWTAERTCSVTRYNKYAGHDIRFSNARSSRTNKFTMTISCGTINEPQNTKSIIISCFTNRQPGEPDGHKMHKRWLMCCGGVNWGGLDQTQLAPLQLRLNVGRYWRAFVVLSCFQTRDLFPLTKASLSAHTHTHTHTHTGWRCALTSYNHTRCLFFHCPTEKILITDGFVCVCVCVCVCACL